MCVCVGGFAGRETAEGIKEKNGQVNKTEKIKKK